MADKDLRPGILSAISDWLKLLALIVLVAEGVILAAMRMTPAENAVAPLYPVFMLLFLLLIVAGVIFDRYLAFRKSEDELSMQIGDKKLSVPGKQLNVVSPPTGALPETLYVDSQRGFQLDLPKSAGWSRAEQLDFGGYLLRQGLLPSHEAIPKFKDALSIHPMGKMLAEASVMCVYEGDPVEVEITDSTTTDALEAMLARAVQVAARRGEKITDEQLSEQRKEIVAKKTPVRKLPVQNSFAVMTMGKALAADSDIPPTLANVFVQNISQSGGAVENLVADDRTILYGSTQTWHNVLINGKQGELTTYAINQLTQSDRFIYMISIAFSPQTRQSLEVWNELQKMMQSFRMLAT